MGRYFTVPRHGKGLANICMLVDPSREFNLEELILSPAGFRP